MVKAMYDELNHTYNHCEAGLQISWKALHEVRMFANVYMCGLQEFCLHAKLQMDFKALDQRGEKRTSCLSKQERRADASTLRLCDESRASMLSIRTLPWMDSSPAELNHQRKRSWNGSTDLRPKDECSRSINDGCITDHFISRHIKQSPNSQIIIICTVN